MDSKKNSKQIFLRAFWLLAMMLIPVGCGPFSSSSDLQIRNGIHLNLGDQNTAPGLVAIGGCSATLVSTNTLMTAAHCTSEGARVCIRSGDYNGTCSNKTYLPRGYAGNNYAWDVALVVFDGNPFKNFFKVTTEEPKLRDPVILVGYSAYRNNDIDKGSKRWGRNTISSFDPIYGGAIGTLDGGSVDRVAVDKGDSGGTMLNNKCELIGVTSRNCGDNGNCSEHTNITKPYAVEWFNEVMQQRGAQICGLPGTSAEYCPSAGMARVDSNPAREEDGTEGFPCAPGGGSSSQDDGRIKIGIAAQGDLGSKLYLSFAGKPSSILACAGDTTAEQCASTAGGTKFTGKVVRESNGRSIFEISRTFSASELSRTWTIVELDGDNVSVKKSRKVRIER